METEMNGKEQERLSQAAEGREPWRKWGPYLSERQWGTVREDYSADGNAWDSFSHEQSRSRAYKWGEDGIAGYCDERMRLCFALAFWNGKDPILKERLFGLTNSEGNHGEDVKEYYFYLDSTPTHSYMKTLYKYPQEPFPYNDLAWTNRSRDRGNLEYELLDTGVFNKDRYWDVFVEYAKVSPEDTLIRVSAVNRGPEAAELHLLPHLWFRNTWWRAPESARPQLFQGAGPAGGTLIQARHPDPDLGERFLYAEQADESLFTENETNSVYLSGTPSPTPYVKDAFHRWLIHGEPSAVNPERRGTKAAILRKISAAPGETKVLRLRLTNEGLEAPFDASFDEVFEARRRESESFYADLTPAGLDADTTRVMRQGFAGLLWSKQTYVYPLDRWLSDRGADPNSGGDRPVRNKAWFHMISEDVISMPDKWEYPWFAAWDLAFHALSFSVVDPNFASQQLDLLLKGRYLHPNGQIPAYEWNFGDVNPPVHAWAVLFLHRLIKNSNPELALSNLERVFQKLLMNFTWWASRKDHDGKNLFEGGFLGLDNIGVFDRSSPMPGGGTLEQADGTAWMALFCQNMLSISTELALHKPVYEDMAAKFYEHFMWISSAMYRDNGLWDDEDGFFYDVLRTPDGNGTRMKVRSMVGLLPLCAATVYPEEVLGKMPHFISRVRWFNERRPELMEKIHPPKTPGVHGRRLLSILNEKNLRRVLSRLFDPEEFLSDFGVRSLSRFHRDHPYSFRWGGHEARVSYLPAESDTGMFGGNSNWRGPIWMPMNVLLIRALFQLYGYFGDNFKVEFPTGSGRQVTLYEAAQGLIDRLLAIFRTGQDGERPVFGGARKFQEDPHWKDHLLFYEYFHGDNGAGLGASHQTGWTGLISLLIVLRQTSADSILNKGLANILKDLKRSPETAGVR